MEMTKLQKKGLVDWATSHEMIVLYFIVGLSILIGAVNPSFISVQTVMLLSRSILVTLIFAMCEMLIIVSGGIDVSFPAVACFTMYSTIKILNHFNLNSVLLMYVIAAAIGILFGLLNAILISLIKIPPLIATLGVSSIANGATLAFLGTNVISKMPSKISQLSRTFLFSWESSEGITYSLTILILIPMVLCILIALVLRYTMLGRGIYAMGGSVSAAHTAGFNVPALQFAVYSFAGMMTGVGGVTFVTLMRQADPKVLMGGEMMVIAAVVLGGTRITGGHGGVLGTVLGVILLALVQNNLIMLGVPTYFQTFFVGLIIVLGIVITSLKSRLEARRPRV